ncbi:MAG TPA: iron ABC transporter permease [Bacillota bacterium]|nr:iron ABC transporter permease [Bacillota bacterium]HNU94505.1 iron ABC transporter permease [Bacillota bacterium]HNY68279.1 iron ABC transporter permease [Bacillota bacterium]HPU76099.1 iron ABC transporter permease [Bacillota bacterium]
MEGSRFNTGQLLLVISTVILIITVVLPVAMIVYNVFFYKWSFDWSLFASMLTDPDNLAAMWNTVKISFFVTTLGTVVGLFFAWLIGRSDIPLKGLMKSLFVIPYMFPPFIGAMAWGLLLAPRSGYINKMFMALTGGRTPLFNINTLAGIVFVELCYYFPFVFIQVSGALERMDPTLEESARIAGANQMTVIRRITMPLVVPAIAAGAMLILISSLSHFGVPAILGFSNGIFTLPTKIYELIYRASGSFEGIRRGASLSILLVAVVVLALALQRRVLRAGRYDIIRGKSMRPMLIKLRGWKVPLLLVCFVFLVITVILPLCTIFGVGFLKAYGVPMKLANMTLNNFKYVLFESKMARDSIRNSFFLSITSAVITMLVGTMIAYVIVKIQPRGKGVLEVLGILPYSIPGIVLAVGVILTWSGAFYLNLYNTIWIILIAYIARYMAFSMKSASASLEQVHDSLEEASRTCGASHFESLLDVTLPLIRPGMVAGFFLIFLPAMRELTTSLLLYGPFTRTMGVAIYSINEEGYTVQACALAGVAIIIIVLGELLLRFVTRERRGQ